MPSSFLSLSLKNRETFKQGQKVHHFLACTSLHTAHDLFFVKYIHFEIGATAAACDPIKQEGRIEEIFQKVQSQI